MLGIESLCIANGQPDVYIFNRNTSLGKVKEMNANLDEFSIGYMSCTQVPKPRINKQVE